ncbi:MAG: DUF3592 domain-containing protein [Natronohydrobacter sp.]|nr:DUF3592 domain-containing protein [Natronohydrobacter sp.]
MERKPFSFWRIARRLGLFWLAFPLIFALGFGGVAISMSAQMILLARDGVTGEAEVLARQIERRRDSEGRETVTYYLQYRYLPEGHHQPITKRQSISRRLYEQVQQGQIIPVTYAWTQPDRATVDPRHDRFGMILFGVVGGIGAVIALGLGGWMLSRKLSVLRALRRGEVREARVTGLRRSNVQKNKVQQYVIDWEDAKGSTGSSMMDAQETLLRHPIGSVIVVYIDPKTGRGWWEAQI